MFFQIINFFQSLNKKQKNSIFKLQILMLVSGFAELLSILMIAVLIIILSDIQIIHTNVYLNYIFIFLSIESDLNFLLLICIFISVLFMSSTFLNLFSVYKIKIISYRFGSDLGNNLFKYYLNQNFLFHINSSSDDIIRKINQEVPRFTNHVISSALNLISKFITSFLIILTLFYYNFYLTSALVIILSVVYLTIYFLVRRTLKYNDQNILQTGQTKFKLMYEGLKAVKELLLYNKQSFIINSFSSNNKLHFYSLAKNQLISETPRYLVEAIIFILGIFGALVVFINVENNFNSFIAEVSIYIIAAYKLVPHFQQIYSNISVIKGNIGSYHILKNDISLINLVEDKNDPVIPKNKKTFFPKKSILFKNVSFKYKENSKIIIKNLNLEIPFGKKIAFIGKTGSGKTTIVDLILGYLTPFEGQILIDNQILDDSNIDSWRSNISYVPQDFFILNTTIIENITLDFNTNNIDTELLEKAVKASELKDFIDSLPEKMETNIGENGIQISGGQRQRIGIARALYRNSDILVMDEATSALDDLTQNKLINSINKIYTNKTLITIAHRVSTIKNADIIFSFENGSLIDIGDFKSLNIENYDFKE